MRHPLLLFLGVLFSSSVGALSLQNDYTHRGRLRRPLVTYIQDACRGGRARTWLSEPSPAADLQADDSRMARGGHSELRLWRLCGRRRNGGSETIRQEQGRCLSYPFVISPEYSRGVHSVRARPLSLKFRVTYHRSGILYPENAFYVMWAVIIDTAHSFVFRDLSSSIITCYRLRRHLSAFHRRRRI